MRHDDLKAKWAAEASKMQQRDDFVRGARLCEEFLADLDGLEECVDEPLLSVREAAQLSGYSADHIGRLVRDGRIPDRRPPGSKGRIAIRRADLPRKPSAQHTDIAGVHDLASRLSTRGKEARNGQP